MKGVLFLMIILFSIFQFQNIFLFQAHFQIENLIIGIVHSPNYNCAY